MPTYEYHCSDCNKDFSLYLSISDHEKNLPPVCQYCGGRNVRQMMAGVTVITSKKS